MKMVPGDLIEWVYEYDDQIVIEDEDVWSTTMQRYVSIGSKFIHVLISIDDEHMSWMNVEGLFHVDVNDGYREQRWRGRRQVTVRKKM